MTTLTLSEVLDIDAINNTYAKKVNELMESIKENGYVGAPIFVHTGINQLVTGSHRLAALKELANEDDSWYKAVVAVDVSDLVDDALEREERTYPEIDYSDIGWIFEGTEIEQYKEEIEEW